MSFSHDLGIIKGSKALILFHDVSYNVYSYWDRMHGAALESCDLRTKFQRASMYSQWPGLFWSVPPMTVCGERSNKGS